MRRPVVWLLLLGGVACEDWLEGPPPGRPVSTALAFEDVSEAAGITGRGATYGAGWGDANGDGFADLWSGNHAGPPSLYLNRGDGTFDDVASRWLPADEVLTYDAHGLAWVDLDNDGRQDLVETVGAGSGQGVGSNRVFQNLGFRLKRIDAVNGLAYELGSGRCPIPYDWNDDGRLDLFVVNQPRADDQAPSALFTQQPSGQFTLEAPIPKEQQHPTALCGQLADLDGDQVMELVRFGRPLHMSAHAIHSGTLVNVSEAVGLPPANRPHDVVIADFDNDLRNDIVVVRWEETSAIVLDEDGYGVKLALRLFGVDEGIRFRSTGDVSIALDPPWFWSPADIKVGGQCRLVSNLSFRLIYGDEANEGLCPFDGGTDRGLFVGREGDEWTLRLSAAIYDRGSLTVRSTEPLEVIDQDLSVLTLDEEASYNRDRLFMGVPGGFQDQGWNRGLQQYTQCESAVAGDFDNDMDLDLYMACASPVQNLPNRLYLNDGKGNFTPMEGHGAEGPAEGRADTVVMADYDNDGFLDLFVTNGYAGPPFNDGPHTLLRNKGNDLHWLELDLEGTRSNRDAIGATVRVTTGKVTQQREVHGGTHNMGQNQRRVHVGLAENEVVDRIDITWPDGTTQVLTNVEADQILRVVQR